MLSLVEQEFVGRDKRQVPLKTPVWEANTNQAGGDFRQQPATFDNPEHTTVVLKPPEQDAKVKCLTYTHLFNKT